MPPSGCSLVSSPSSIIAAPPDAPTICTHCLDRLVSLGYPLDRLPSAILQHFLVVCRPILYGEENHFDTPGRLFLANYPKNFQGSIYRPTEKGDRCEPFQEKDCFSVDGIFGESERGKAPLGGR